MGNSPLYNGKYLASELKFNEPPTLDGKIQRLKIRNQNLSVAESFGP
jgi:hypothetical protein